MAKGWTLVGTNGIEFSSTETLQDKRRREHKFNNFIRNTKRQTLKEMAEESERLFEQKKEQERNLLEAFNNKKLKSKALIKKAKSLIHM